MIRTVVYLLIAIFLITFLRYIIGAIVKAFGGLLQPRGPSPSKPGSSYRARTADELRKDPVCGTFVATASGIKESVRGEVVYFCSTECRDKYLASRAD